jgi:hypothetical protein
MIYSRLLGLKGFLGWVVRASCAVIAAAVGASAAGSALAQQLAPANAFYLERAGYNVPFPAGVTGYAGYVVGSSSPLGIVLNPAPASHLFYSTNGGTPHANYALVAGTGSDGVDGTFFVQGAPNSVAYVGAQLLAETQFEVEVVKSSGATPPATIKSVPILVTATGNVDCSNSASNAQAIVTLGLLAPLTGSPDLTAACNTPGIPDNDIFNISTEGQLPIGELSTITKEAAASTQVNACVPGPAVTSCPSTYDTTQVSAFVDPTIEIDPSFAYAKDFVLEYSPGYSPGGSAVPEPSTWLLLASGFGALILHRGSVRKRSVRP